MLTRPMYMPTRVIHADKDHRDADKDAYYMLTTGVYMLTV